jgi:hypothetical protein
MINNLKNQIIKNIFTKEEMDLIYDHINNASDENLFFHPELGYKAYHCGMPQSIQDKALSVAQQYSDLPLKLTEVSAARYANGYINPPNLYPHVDLFEAPRFTFDIQLKSTRNWPIVVEGKEFVLRDNEAIIFSGTNQLHWRTKTTFKDDDIVDMLFCHFSEDSDSPTLNTEEFTKHMMEREEEFKKMYYSDILDDYYKNKE